jgi:serine phosphatase RsbU (regulator of sigma subunit)
VTAVSDRASERLRQFEALTDTTLAHLGAKDLINELLDRVRDTLETDSAVVMLLDQSADELVAVAASGLEEEGKQGVRVPLATGFAGRVASERRPIILGKVDTAKVVNSILPDTGVRSLLGVPLIAENRVVGVLNVGTLQERQFTEDDAELLQLVGDRIALAVQNQLASEARTSARALQRSLLPARLPRIAGLQLAARYVPGEAERIGGDWYDLFTLPSGRFCVVIGDVAGHGLPAAVIMGRLRSALRAYALEHEDPAQVLHLLNRKAQHFETGAMATVLYAVFDISLDRVDVSLAGHLPPVVASPDQPTALADLPVDPPIGVQAKAPRRTSTLHFTENQTLCLFTDGLVERRGIPIDTGLNLLCQQLSHQAPDLLCNALMAAMVGDAPADDDIALLVIRRHTADGKPASI